MKHLQFDEAKICGSVVDEALRRGLLVSVYDGEEWTLKASANRDAISEVVGITCETVLVFRDPAKLDHGQPSRVGKVFLVHGNGCDVISDYTDNSEMAAILAPASAVSGAMI